MRMQELSRGSHPLSFGRKVPRALVAAAPAAAAEGDDLRLFAWTFAAGFVFMTVFLA